MAEVTAVSARSPDAVIDQKAIRLQSNMKEHKFVEGPGGEYRLEDKKRSRFDRVVSLTETSYFGNFRFGQLGDRIFKLLNIIHPNEGLKNVSTMFNKAWTVTIIPRLFGVTKEAKEAVIAAGKPAADFEAARRKHMKAVHGVADATSAWGYASSLFLACFKKTASACLTVFRVADTVTFVGDVSDLQMQGEDLSKSRALAARAKQLNVKSEVLQTIQDTKNYHWLKTGKAVCSVAGFILGLGLIATGAGALLGFAIAAASISLGATLLAMSASLKEEGMKYERIKYFDEKHVKRLPAQVTA